MGKRRHTLNEPPMPASDLVRENVTGVEKKKYWFQVERKKWTKTRSHNIAHQKNLLEIDESVLPDGTIPKLTVSKAKLRPPPNADSAAWWEYSPAKYKNEHGFHSAKYRSDTGVTSQRPRRRTGQRHSADSLYNKGQKLLFQSLNGTRLFAFKAFITDFSDSWDHGWESEEGFNRMDHMEMFTANKRTITLSWKTVAEDVDEAFYNMQTVNGLIKSLYPHIAIQKPFASHVHADSKTTRRKRRKPHEGGETWETRSRSYQAGDPVEFYSQNAAYNIETKSPGGVLLVKFGNLIRDWLKGYSPAGMPIDDGALCKFESFSQEYSEDDGWLMYKKPFSIMPKVIKLTATMTVLHQMTEVDVDWNERSSGISHAVAPPPMWERDFWIDASGKYNPHRFGGHTGGTRVVDFWDAGAGAYPYHTVHTVDSVVDANLANLSSGDGYGTWSKHGSVGNEIAQSITMGIIGHRYSDRDKWYNEVPKK